MFTYFTIIAIRDALREEPPTDITSKLFILGMFSIRIIIFLLIDLALWPVQLFWAVGMIANYFLKGSEHDSFHSNSISINKTLNSKKNPSSIQTAKKTVKKYHKIALLGRFAEVKIENEHGTITGHVLIKIEDLSIDEKSYKFKEQISKSQKYNRDNIRWLTIINTGKLTFKIKKDQDPENPENYLKMNFDPLFLIYPVHYKIYDSHWVTRDYVMRWSPIGDGKNTNELFIDSNNPKGLRLYDSSKNSYIIWRLMSVGIRFVN